MFVYLHEKVGIENIKITQIVKQKENFDFEYTFNGVILHKKNKRRISLSLNLSELKLI